MLCLNVLEIRYLERMKNDEAEKGMEQLGQERKRTQARGGQYKE